MSMMQRSSMTAILASVGLVLASCAGSAEGDESVEGTPDQEVVGPETRHDLGAEPSLDLDLDLDDEPVSEGADQDEALVGTAEELVKHRRGTWERRRGVVFGRRATWGARGGGRHGTFYGGHGWGSEPRGGWGRRPGWWGEHCHRFGTCW